MVEIGTDTARASLGLLLSGTAGTDCPPGDLRAIERDNAVHLLPRCATS